MNETINSMVDAYRRTSVRERKTPWMPRRSTVRWITPWKLMDRDDGTREWRRFAEVIDDLDGYLQVEGPIVPRGAR